MRTFDLSPLYRNTVGFDRLFKMVDQLADPQHNSYPPYNIERLNENDYRISIAVAGFTDQELTIESKENSLIVRGEKNSEEMADKPEYLYQGIAARAFERRFQLADHVLVNGARLENGDGLALIHASNEDSATRAEALIRKAYSLAQDAPAPLPLLVEKLTG